MALHKALVRQSHNCFINKVTVLVFMIFISHKRSNWQTNWVSARMQVYLMWQTMPVGKPHYPIFANGQVN
ncbi:Uncharacterised protein [Mycobacteroides abscessus subsp. abscessus]|nr:Uncharacterised protein [Mycobacteroides abscessus subsp. abscessus]